MGGWLGGWPPGDGVMGMKPPGGPPRLRSTGEPVAGEGGTGGWGRLAAGRPAGVTTFPDAHAASARAATTTKTGQPPPPPAPLPAAIMVVDVEVVAGILGD